jgi:hypothetical protein
MNHQWQQEREVAALCEISDLHSPLQEGNLRPAEQSQSMLRREFRARSHLLPRRGENVAIL